MGMLKEVKSINAADFGLHELTDEELHQIHRILLDLVDDVKRVCDKYDIKWGIAGGCALGALRHEGFIPWDDDVDLIMTRADYKKFSEVYTNDMNPKYEFITPGEEGYYAQIPRIYDTHTTAQSIQSSGKGKGLYIEIFVLDNTYDNQLLKFFHGVECSAYLFIVSCLTTDKQKETLMKFGTSSLIKKVRLRCIMAKVFSYRSVEKWIIKAIKCYSKVKDENSTYVVSVTGGGHYFREQYERKRMCIYRDLPFEDRIYPFMMDIEYFCRTLYGDNYMELPPVEKREKHAYVNLNLKQ